MENGDIIYYYDEINNIKEGIFKGILTGVCRFCPTSHIIDMETGENLLISSDYVFNTFEDAKEFFE